YRSSGNSGASGHMGHRAGPYGFAALPGYRRLAGFPDGGGSMALYLHALVGTLCPLQSAAAPFSFCRSCHARLAAHRTARQAAGFIGPHAHPGGARADLVLVMAAASDPLAKVLREARERLRTRGLIWLPVAALLTGSLAGIGLGMVEAAQRLGWVALDLDLPALPVIAGAAAIGALGATIAYLAQKKRRESRAVALLVDGRAGMKLAYATAIETTEQATPGRVAVALMKTARERAEQLDIPQLVPLWTNRLSTTAIESPVQAPHGRVAVDLKKPARERAEQLDIPQLVPHWTNRLRKASITGLALAAMAVALHFAMPPSPHSAGPQRAETPAPAP